MAKYILIGAVFIIIWSLMLTASWRALNTWSMNGSYKNQKEKDEYNSNGGS